MIYGKHERGYCSHLPTVLSRQSIYSSAIASVLWRLTQTRNYGGCGVGTLPVQLSLLWHQGLLQSPQQVPSELMSHSIKTQKEVAEETPAELNSAEEQQDNLWQN